MEPDSAREVPPPSFVSVAIYNEERGLRVHADLAALDDLENDDLVWIDVESSEPEMLQKLAEYFELHELTVEDCLTPGHFPKLEDFGTYLFMIFRVLRPDIQLDRESEEEGANDPDSDEVLTQKVAIYLSRQFVITYRRREIPWLDALVRQVRSFPESTIAQGTDALAYRVIDVLVDRFLRALGVFDRFIDTLEDTTIQSPDQFDMADVLFLRRKLTALRQIMRDQRYILNRLANETTLIREKQRRRYFRDIDDHALTILNTIDKQVDSIISLRDAHFALANVRLGDTMRVLTIITTVAAPLNIVAGIYGMNFDVLPFAHNPGGFWIIMVLMVLLAVLMLMFFRQKRWL